MACDVVLMFDLRVDFLGLAFVFVWGCVLGVSLMCWVLDRVCGWFRRFVCLLCICLSLGFPGYFSFLWGLRFGFAVVLRGVTRLSRIWALGFACFCLAGGSVGYGVLGVLS